MIFAALLTLAAYAVLSRHLATGDFLLHADALGFGNGGLFLIWAFGHCDGMDGPVVTLAKKALESGNVNFVLPWVLEKDEAEIRKTFEHTMSVRKLDPAARELADRFFFETLVRLHRAGEGAPYTGLKPAGRNLGPAIPAADKALEDGSVEAVIKLVTDAVADGIRRHFKAASSRKRFAPDDVKGGREYVEAYVPYVHYVERLFEAAKGPAHGHHAEGHERAVHAH
jgi:hypothetical protein